MQSKHNMSSWRIKMVGAAAWNKIRIYQVIHSKEKSMCDLKKWLKTKCHPLSFTKLTCALKYWKITLRKMIREMRPLFDHG